MLLHTTIGRPASRELTGLYVLRFRLGVSLLRRLDVAVPVSSFRQPCRYRPLLRRATGGHQTDRTRDTQPDPNQPSEQWLGLTWADYKALFPQDRRALTVKRESEAAEKHRAESIARAK